MITAYHKGVCNDSVTVTAESNTFKTASEQDVTERASSKALRIRAAQPGAAVYFCTDRRQSSSQYSSRPFIADNQLTIGLLPPQGRAAREHPVHGGEEEAGILKMLHG